MRIELNEAGTEQTQYQELVRGVTLNSPQDAVFLHLRRALKHVLFYDVGSVDSDISTLSRVRIEECTRLIKEQYSMPVESVYAGAIMTGKYQWLERAALPAATFCRYVVSASWASPLIELRLGHVTELARNVYLFLQAVASCKSEMRRWYLVYLVLPAMDMSLFTEIAENNGPAGLVIQFARDMIIKELKMYGHMESLVECRTNGEGVYL